MVDEITTTVGLATKVADAIIGPTGGLMAICFAFGAYCGWRFSEYVLIKRYREEVQNLRDSILANEKKCREEITELATRLRAVEDSRVDILKQNNNSFHKS